MRIGFIGTGTISAAVVSGLQSLPNAPDVIVSPRSEAVSEALAARYPKVHRAGSNAEVATADIVFLGMRPMHLEEAMAGIDFKAGQIVASMVAGFSLADVQARWPEATVCRFIPLPGIAHGKGPMATYPEVPEIVRLFTPLGDLFVAPDEARIHSDDPGSARQGGDLGWVAADGEMVPEFEKMMTTIAPNQLSEVFQSPYGWHLLEVTGEREEDVSDRYRANLARQALYARQYDEELAAWLRELRSEAYVEILDKPQ